jgi:glycosyltransferase involved in cell wall biosynthesis
MQLKVMISKTSPTISIIVPIYNAGKYLHGTLMSVLNQTYKKWELILINDGSIDESIEIINKFVSNDTRIKVINQLNQGVVKARENGINSAEGEFLLFLDADDELPEKSLIKLVEMICDTNSDIICGAHFNIKNELHKKHIPFCNGTGQLSFIKSILKGDFLSTVWGNLYRRKLFENLKEFPNLKIGEDLSLNLQLVCDKNPTISIIDDVVYHYFTRENSVMQNTDPVSGKSRIDFVLYLEHFLKDNGWYEQTKKELGFRFTQIWVWLIFNNQKKILKNSTYGNFFKEYFILAKPIVLPYMKKIGELYIFSPLVCQMVIKFKNKF